MTGAKPDTAASQIELLSFRVAGQDYSADIMSVREIRSWTKATPLPHSQPFVRGVINLRGTVLPVIDLAQRLGLPEVANSERNVIIVVEIGKTPLGLLVEAVSDILSIDSTEMTPPPEIKADDGRKFIHALTVIDERMFKVLDLSSILPETTKEAA